MTLTVLNKCLVASLIVHAAISLISVGYVKLINKDIMVEKKKEPITVKIIELNSKYFKKEKPVKLKNKVLPLMHMNKKVTKINYSSENPLKKPFKSVAPPPWKKLKVKEKEFLKKVIKSAELEKKKPEYSELNEEPIPLNTKDKRYLDYFAYIKGRIFEEWKYPEAALNSGMYGRLKLKFVINEDGELVKIMLVSTSGHNLLDEEALTAVKKASPYGSIPPNIRKRVLPIVVTFNYFPTYATPER